MRLSFAEKLSIPRQWGISLVNVLFFMVLMGACAVALSLWVQSWTSSYDEAVAQTQAAARVSDASAFMFINAAAAIQASQDEAGRATYDSVREQNRTQAIEAFDTLAGLEEDDVEDSTALATMRSTFDQLDQSLLSALEVAKTDVMQALDSVTVTIQPLVTQLGQQANDYLANEQAQQQSEVDHLSSMMRLSMIGMICLLALGIISGSVSYYSTSRTLRKRLGAAVSSISTSAAQLLAVSAQVAASAAQTAASSNETTATVEEVKQTAQLAHEKAAEVTETSQNVARVAVAGRNMIEETLVGIEQMQNQMSVVSDTIDRLADQTQAVGEIITTVNDLAEQSNLLSVNASIEAAKAGEQGKGFTVVAQEVKSLAEQSKQAVAQVRAILGEIQKASTQAVQAAQQGRQAIEAARQQSLSTGDPAGALTGTTDEAVQAAVQISASSRQQLAGMEQISQAVESINQATVQAVSGTRQVEQEVKNLQDLAHGLRRLVESGATA